MLNRRIILVLALCATAVGGMLMAGAAAVLTHPEWGASRWIVAFVAEKWQRFLFGPAGQLVALTAGLVVMELFFLTWEKTTVFRVFVRRNRSAVTDLGFTFLSFSTLKWLVEYVLTLGVAFLAVRLGDTLATRLGWARWELPSDGVLAVILAFTIYFLSTTFIGYWQHRLLHWRWFWNLHRFHHSATELNLLTGFRVNPAESVTNVVTALSPLVFFKVPNAGLFANFVFVNLVLGQLQHSELPWTFGWFGRWVVTPPSVHHIHHSVDPEHHHSNYSNCPLWDRLFGTWYAGEKRPSAYGIAGGEHIERPATQWLIDVWLFYREVVRSLAGVGQRVVARLKGPQPQATTSSAAVPSE